MSILFSRQCEYALQAVMYLALKQNGEIVSIKELAARLRIPYHFLAKILQELTHHGLLKSQKGPAGGFALKVPAREITLFHIIGAIDGASFARNCVLGFEECSKKNPCALHDQWAKSRDGIVTMLTRKNIAQMATRTKKVQYQNKNSPR